MAVCVVAAGGVAVGLGTGAVRSLTDRAPSATVRAGTSAGTTAGTADTPDTGDRPAGSPTDGSPANGTATTTTGVPTVTTTAAEGAPPTSWATAGSVADRPSGNGNGTTYGSVFPSDDVLAREVLDTIPVLLERQAGYDRDLFPTWSRAGEPGCDVRDVVLIAESVTPVDRRAPCTIVSGTWVSAYDGATATSPSAVQIDHVVALKEAWDSGAWAWPAERRVAYANDLSDPRTLIAVSGSSNSAKGDKDPSNWLPRGEDVCRFLADWVAVKARWGLAMDPSEWGRVKNQLEGPCTGTRLAPWPPAP